MPIQGIRNLQLSYLIRYSYVQVSEPDLLSSRSEEKMSFLPYVQLQAFYYIFVRISPRAICWLSKIGNQSNTSHARDILLESWRQGTKCLSVPFQLYQDTVDVYVVTSDKYIERKRERNKSLANTQRL